MSGQASRSHALRSVRWREQAARAAAIVASPFADEVDGADGWGHARDLILAGSKCIDVHAAREWAESESRATEELALHRHIYDDWRRWHGPEHVNREAPTPPGYHGWAARRRVAQRLLDTLDGRCPWAPSAPAQPSECRRCDGHGKRKRRTSPGMPARRDTRCEDCNGTGHNLRGYLPAVEWSTALIRWAEDGQRAAHDEGTGDPRVSGPNAQADPLQVRILDDSTEQGWRLMPGQRTRACERGEHLIPDLDNDSTTTLNGAAFELDVHPSIWAYDAHVRSRNLLRLPRWRRGELRHAEQRRERERIRDTALDFDMSEEELAAAVRWTRENMISIPGFMATFPEFHMMVTPGEE